MSDLSRRRWIQKSLLASSAMLVTVNSSALNAVIESNKNYDGPLLRLNWNENPYGPSDKAKQAIIQALTGANRYPDSLVGALKEKLATVYSLQPKNFMLTAGSTEVLSLLGQHVGLQKGEILTPWPSFPTLIMFGEQTGASIRKVKLDNGDRINLERVKEAISDKTKLIFICNPNNPTSTELDTGELRAFLKTVPSDVLVCVDEAYIEYSKYGVKSSVVDLITELSNLVVCRTFSKAYGLAGLRIGYAISNEANIDALRNRHTGWELSAGVAPVAGASATLDDPQFLDMVVERNEEGKSIVTSAFDKWGLEYSKSSTNFIYAKSAGFHADIVDKMKENNILITKWPDMTEHIRISIGKPDEMEQFVKAVEQYVA